MTKLVPNFKDFLNEITINHNDFYHNSWKDVSGNLVHLNMYKDDNKKIIIVELDFHEKSQDMSNFRESPEFKSTLSRVINLVSDVLIRKKFIGSDYHLGHKMPNDLLTQVFSHLKHNLKLKELPYFHRHLGMVLLPLEK